MKSGKRTDHNKVAVVEPNQCLDDINTVLTL